MKPQINTNVESFLLVYLFVLLIDFYEGIINKHLLSCSTDFFCQVDPHPLFLIDNIGLPLTCSCEVALKK